jgi:hypothetical protein
LVDITTIDKIIAVLKQDDIWKSVKQMVALALLLINIWFGYDRAILLVQYNLDHDSLFLLDSNQHQVDVVIRCKDFVLHVVQFKA